MDTNSTFCYNITMKLHDLPGTEVAVKYPDINDLTMASRSFRSYIESAKSLKALLSDVVVDANKGGADFTISIEVNPLHSGTETVSKDWMDHEVARMWLVSKSQLGKSSMIASAKGQIFYIPQEARSSN